MGVGRVNWVPECANEHSSNGSMRGRKCRADTVHYWPGAAALYNLCWDRLSKSRERRKVDEVEETIKWYRPRHPQRHKNLLRDSREGGNAAVCERRLTCELLVLTGPCPQRVGVGLGS